jgi:hypothetical protein
MEPDGLITLIRPRNAMDDYLPGENRPRAGIARPAAGGRPSVGRDTGRWKLAGKQLLADEMSEVFRVHRDGSRICYSHKEPRVSSRVSLQNGWGLYLPNPEGWTWGVLRDVQLTQYR